MELRRFQLRTSIDRLDPKARAPQAEEEYAAVMEEITGALDTNYSAYSRIAWHGGRCALEVLRVYVRVFSGSS